MNARRSVLAILVAVVAASCAGPRQATRPAAPSPSAKPPTAGIAGYVAHLEARGRDPKDYVLGLFASHDVVILGERLHPETTQWELIFDLVTDPRFVAEVGTIYTEYGAVNLQDRLDAYLANPRATREQLFAILRDFGNWPMGWGNANFVEFLDRLRQFNTAQPPDARVQLRFSDGFWDWRSLDASTFDSFAGVNLFARDFLMARRIERGVLLEQPHRKKALVVMNTRHSYVIDHGALDDNTGSYLRRLLAPHKLSVVSVLLNTTARASEGGIALVAAGRWDAAFRALGDRPIGFDLAGSPFADDAFDLHERYRHLRYRDVYHGVVFVNPVAKFMKQELARGYVTPAFISEVRRRMTFASIGRTAAEQQDNRRRIEKVLDILATPNLPAAVEAELYGLRPVYRGKELVELERQLASWAQGAAR